MFVLWYIDLKALKAFSYFLYFFTLNKDFYIYCFNFVLLEVFLCGPHSYAWVPTVLLFW